MNRLAAILFVCAVPLIRGEEMGLPANLPTYEKYVAAKIAAGLPTPREEKIRITVAAGDGGTVQKQDEIEIPRGSTAKDAAAYWEKKHGSPLLGWAQGLVVIRRKIGGEVTRITWSMRQARTEAPRFQMQNGDVLIGLVYADM